ncbi:MAG: MarR family winged helix-turn-helix transcriptional regulator [Hyphomonadaceae bacterium]
MPDTALASLGALAEALRPVLLRLSRNLRRDAQRFGLSPLDVHLLVSLVKAPGAGVSELAEREQISKAAMSAHVKRLEEAGWLVRDEDGQEDRRRVGLAATPAGIAALEEVRRSRTDWLAARLAELPAKDRAALEAALPALAALAGEAG